MTLFRVFDLKRDYGDGVVTGETGLHFRDDHIAFHAK